MTKKDYVQIASAIGQVMADIMNSGDKASIPMHNTCWFVASNLETRFSKDNPLFNKNKFEDLIREKADEYNEKLAG